MHAIVAASSELIAYENTLPETAKVVHFAPEATAKINRKWAIS